MHSNKKWSIIIPGKSCSKVIQMFLFIYDAGKWWVGRYACKDDHIIHFKIHKPLTFTICAYVNFTELPTHERLCLNINMYIEYTPHILANHTKPYYIRATGSNKNLNNTKVKYYTHISIFQQEKIKWK